MKKGVIAFPPPWECIHRPCREMKVKPFGEQYGNFAVDDEEEVMN
jgi:CRISPR-associated protein Cas5d